jgi:hypothetical protein
LFNWRHCAYAFISVQEQLIRNHLNDLLRMPAEVDTAFTNDPALPLQNLGVDPRPLGHHEDALHVDEETVDHCRKLTKAGPTFTNNLAQSTQNLGPDLSMSHHEDVGFPVVIRPPSDNPALTSL